MLCYITMYVPKYDPTNPILPHVEYAFLIRSVIKNIIQDALKGNYLEINYNQNISFLRVVMNEVIDTCTTDIPEYILKKIDRILVHERSIRYIINPISLPIFQCFHKCSPHVANISIWNGCREGKFDSQNRSIGYGDALTNISVDCIVIDTYSDTPTLVPNKTIQSKLYARAGPRLLAEFRKKAAESLIDFEHVICTKSFNLPCHSVYHIVTPMYNKQNIGMSHFQLTQCYITCLKQAEKMNHRSIAFGLSPTGFPKIEAMTLAIDSILSWNSGYNIHVIFCVDTPEQESGYLALINNRIES
jgi:O-acetyl-ADP-ribose deacetylase (regulator of RNase III)